MYYCKMRKALKFMNKNKNPIVIRNNFYNFTY
jgi:hypothetical protein